MLHISACFLSSSSSIQIALGSHAQRRLGLLRSRMEGSRAAFTHDTMVLLRVSCRDKVVVLSRGGSLIFKLPLDFLRHFHQLGELSLHLQAFDALSAELLLQRVQLRCARLAHIADRTGCVGVLARC